MHTFYKLTVICRHCKREIASGLVEIELFPYMQQEALCGNCEKVLDTRAKEAKSAGERSKGASAIRNYGPVGLAMTIPETRITGGE